MRQKRETVVNFVANVEALLKERECVCVRERGRESTKNEVLHYGFGYIY